jgi:hypothetical protein
MKVADKKRVDYGFSQCTLWCVILFLNSYLPSAGKEYVPRVSEMAGSITAQDSKDQNIGKINVGRQVLSATTFHTHESSELIFSLPGKIVVRLSENTSVVLGPAQDNHYEVKLLRGTVTALLDPQRDRQKEPTFAVRGSGGITEATGTFYAVTEYKGQTYSAVKKGKVVKKTLPPDKPDFSAYLKKAKSKSTTTKTSKTD